MTITASIVADSISPAGVRLTTMALTYPRFIHAEFMTHRVFSRNASSSRAIPVLKGLSMTLRNSAAPIHWGANQPGMQASMELEGVRRWIAERAWHSAKWACAFFAWVMHKAGAHKQIVNRIMEPWSHITVLVTATDWANWFALRDHPDAQPEIRALAQAMREAMDQSEPRLLQIGEWHLPYVSDDERTLWGEHKAVRVIPYLAQISAARCARVSYLTHDGRAPAHADDLRLYERLRYHQPMHASPLEHQATPDTYVWNDRNPEEGEGWQQQRLHGNTRGWIQHRKLLPNEAALEINRSKEAA